MNPLEDLAGAATQLESLSDEAAQFVAGEVRLAELGVKRSSDAVDEGDLIGAALWRRLAAEAALRLSWIAGDELEGDADGEIVLDPVACRERANRLRSRDVRMLLSAYRAVQWGRNLTG